MELCRNHLSFSTRVAFIQIQDASAMARCLAYLLYGHFVSQKKREHCGCTRNHYSTNVNYPVRFAERNISMNGTENIVRHRTLLSVLSILS